MNIFFTFLIYFLKIFPNNYSRPQNPFLSDNLNIDSKKVIPIKRILIGDVQIKQDVLKYSNNLAFDMFTISSSW